MTKILGRMMCIAAFAAAVLFAAGASAQQAAKEGEVCGGLANTPCAAGLWCDPLSCFALSGRCVKVGQVCPAATKSKQAAPAAFIPVCGCNLKTYGSDCERRTARVAKLRDGQCLFDRKG